MANTEENFDYIKCALSKDGHISRQPIVLTNCSHTACKFCLSSRLSNKIKCGICEVVTERDFKNDTESIQTKKLINLSLAELYQFIEKRTSEIFMKIKEIKYLNEEKIDLHVKYIEEEVEIRIESIKARLDNIHENIKNDLKAIKKSLFIQDDFTISFEKQLYQLKQDISKHTEYNENKFYEYQSNCIKMNEKLAELKNFFFELKIQPSELKLNTKNLIGDLHFFKKSFNSDIDVELLLSSTILERNLLKKHDPNICEATFQFKLSEFNKLKDSNDRRISGEYLICNFPFRAIAQSSYFEGVKVLSVILNCCEYKSKAWKIPVRFEFKLVSNKVNATATDHFSKSMFFKFHAEESRKGHLPFISFKEIIDDEKGYYNAIDDSIKLEITVKQIIFYFKKEYNLTNNY